MHHGHPHPSVRLAGSQDARCIAQLLHDFNNEFDEPTPTVVLLTRTIAKLLERDDFVAFLAGVEPCGLAILWLRPAIWTPGCDATLAELYVRPECRRRGLGAALVATALAVAADRGASLMEVPVEESDSAARRLYERFGFSRMRGGTEGDLMYHYERSLAGSDALTTSDGA